MNAENSTLQLCGTDRNVWHSGSQSSIARNRLSIDVAGVVCMSAASPSTGLRGRECGGSYLKRGTSRAALLLPVSPVPVYLSLTHRAQGLVASWG